MLARRLLLPAVVLGALVPAAPAGARVRIGADRVVLSTAAGRAVVERASFRLTILDRRGRIVLRGVTPSRRPVRTALPPTDDPGPFGRSPAARTAAPLAFLVGRRRLEQWSGTFWAGNVLSSRRQGTWFAARRVIGVRARGRGVRLVVATSDPSGRRLVVDLGPDAGGAVRLRARPVPARGVVAMADAYRAPPGEAFHGFGGRHWGVDQRGKTLVNWTAQENVGGAARPLATTALPALALSGTGRSLAQLGGPPADPPPGGAGHALLPGGPSAAYDPQAQFTSPRGYGYLLDRPELSRFRLAAGGARRWTVDVDARELDATIVPARDERAAVAGLTAITGRHRLPPAWAMEPMLSRAIRNGTETSRSYEAKISADLAQIERRRPPLGAYAFEGWGLLPRAFVRATVARLHRLGLRAVLYVRLYVSDDPLRSQPAGDVATALRRRLVATDAAGRPYRFDANGAPGWVLDPTNPATLRWWRARLALVLRLGADGFMQDFGEQVLARMRFHDGSTGATMHNRLPGLFARASRAFLDGAAHRPGAWFFTRAGFSGRPGSAAYEMGTFPGDETADWSAASGLRSLGPDMLNRAVGGAFGFDTDIAGYIDVPRPADAELFTRWSQWAALSPYFRVHNTGTAGVRMPWSFGAATYRRWLAAARLHARAVPLLRRLWRTGRRTGVPPTRPLWLADPGARIGRRVDDEWLLGPNVLVAPVVREGARSRAVVFPSGCWRAPGGAPRVHGPVRRSVRAPLGRLPWFVRCGSRPL